LADVEKARRRDPCSAAEKIAACLRWDVQDAVREIDFAEQVVRVLPPVHAEMLAGRMDRTKARVFVESLRGLPAEHQTSICAVLIPPAAGWNSDQLADQLRRMIVRIDPDGAEQRYLDAIRESDVSWYLDYEATLSFGEHGLTTGETRHARQLPEVLASGDHGRVARPRPPRKRRARKARAQRARARRACR
jgi:hypothetical protein